MSGAHVAAAARCGAIVASMTVAARTMRIVL
jgi:hypothetical protein